MSKKSKKRARKRMNSWARKERGVYFIKVAEELAGIILETLRQTSISERMFTVVPKEPDPSAEVLHA